MTTTEKDPVRFAEQAEAVCLTYAQAVERLQRGDHTVSLDEMTGIQARERTAPTKPARPGLVERREFEYIVTAQAGIKGRPSKASYKAARTRCPCLRAVEI